MLYQPRDRREPDAVSKVAAVSVEEQLVAACRLCSAPLGPAVIDLGDTPLANAYLRPDQLGALESRYPLRAHLCGCCHLLQLEPFVTPLAIFGEYAYFSSYSTTLLDHSRRYAAAMCERLALGPGDRVVEIASNDGYLLQYFLARGIDVLGVEPAANVAAVARHRGVATLVQFFGSKTARELVEQGCRPRLIVANNVLAHVPHLNDFVSGLAILLAPGGLATLEFHHLLSLIANRQFDTIYHEHFQYFSLAAARAVFERHGLAVVDAEELPAQGGSLRVYVRHAADASAPATDRLEAVLEREDADGLSSAASYARFSDDIVRMKRALLCFLADARASGKRVVCYGAAAKGNTLLNYCGVGADSVDYAVDRSPHKQGLYLPGSLIPICHPDRVAETKPDYVLILPWNLRDEIVAQMSHVRSWGGRFVVPVPEVSIV